MNRNTDLNSNSLVFRNIQRPAIKFRPVPICPTKDTVEVSKQDWDELVKMSRRLLRASDMIAQQLYIVQPFLGIVKDHHKIINKLNLFEEK